MQWEKSLLHILMFVLNFVSEEADSSVLTVPMCSYHEPSASKTNLSSCAATTPQFTEAEFSFAGWGVGILG